MHFIRLTGKRLSITLSPFWRPHIIGAANGLRAQPTNPAAPIPTLQINAAQVTGQINPHFYGLMTEEINYACEAASAGELIRNRSFKASTNIPIVWSLVQENGGVGAISLDDTQPLNDALNV